MSEKPRDEDGTFSEVITPQEVLEAVRNGGHIVTSSDVADTLGCTREAARLKLTDLHDAGKIERRKVGSTAVVWWADGE